MYVYILGTNTSYLRLAEEQIIEIVFWSIQKWIVYCCQWSELSLRLYVLFNKSFTLATKQTSCQSFKFHIN